MMFDTIQLQHYLEQPRTVKMVLVVLAIGLLLTLVQLSEIIINPPEQVVPTEVNTRVTEQIFIPTPLFGESPDGILQQTRLQLTLKGTFAGTNAQAGSAVIGSPNKGDKVYVVGDTVEGAKIIDIQPDYIVLEYQGNKEILRLPEGQRLMMP